jgi:endonuclease III related protein
VLEVYRFLLRSRGPAGWWPGGGPFEVCVGAVLVQNTAWVNVERALATLRRRRALSFRRMHALGAAGLAPLIRSSGTYNVKARRLAALLDFLRREYGGRVEKMAGEEPLALRAKLLAVPGVGRETADSIVLYAAGLPLFVVDAYTRRVFTRLGLLSGNESYDTIQAFFMERLPRKAALFNDYHAQIVLLAQGPCRVRPRCGECPLDAVCAKRGVTAPAA